MRLRRVRDALTHFSFIRLFCLSDAILHKGLVPRHFHFETILQRITFRPSSVIISSMDHCQRIEYHAYKLNIRRSISSFRSYFEPRKVRRILLIHHLSANLPATILPLSDPHKRFQEQLRSPNRMQETSISVSCCNVSYLLFVQLF